MLLCCYIENFNQIGQLGTMLQLFLCFEENGCRQLFWIFRWRRHEQFKNNTWSPHCSQSYSFPGLLVPEKQIVLKNPKWLSGGHIEFQILIRWTIYDPLVVMFIHTKSEVNPWSSFRARGQKVEKFTSTTHDDRRRITNDAISPLG